MKVIAVSISKGGTGKTSTAAAIAQAGAANGKRVLAIDLDPQMNLTDFIGADAGKSGSYQLLHGQDIEELIQETPQGIYCIAASENLAAVNTTPQSAKRLAAALKPIRGIDLCVIDTPAGMLELQNVAFQAATDLLIPLEADRSSLQGLYQTADRAKTAQRTNRALTITGVVITKSDPRPLINKHLQKVIAETAANLDIPYLMAIRNSVKLKEAQAMQQSIYDYAPKCKPAIDYMNLYKMIFGE